ncbi:hypothetical protein BDZ89DRAFT_1076818 [Hymenopellis radicata]|nr:hypothetical protein BDZ89DRAFT_1076818 [Hymenopellis radicata]
MEATCSAYSGTERTSAKDVHVRCRRPMANGGTYPSETEFRRTELVKFYGVYVEYGLVGRGHLWKGRGPIDFKVTHL